MTTSVLDFGAALVQTQDLDPVYVGLRYAGLPRSQLARLMLAYWCFYHLGAACAMSELEDDWFWQHMREAAQNEDGRGPNFILCRDHLPPRWPRAAERRHFRGQKCVEAVDWLARSSPHPEDYVEFLSTAQTERQVMSIVQGWPMFGPWVAFKAADMMERVWGTDIRFSPDAILMYDEPRAALGLLLEHHPTWTQTDPTTLYHKLLTHFSGLRAPPDKRRCCGPQEVETILCKWKSHIRGHYHVGKDTTDVRHALEGWGTTAQRVLEAMPPEVATRGATASGASPRAAPTAPGA